MPRHTNQDFLDMILAYGQTENFEAACKFYNTYHCIETTPDTIKRIKNNLLQYGQFRRPKRAPSQTRVGTKTADSMDSVCGKRNDSTKCDVPTTSKYLQPTDSFQQLTDKKIVKYKQYENLLNKAISFLRISCEDTPPLSILQSESFKRFFKKILLQYTICQSLSTMERSISSKYSRLSQMLKEKLKDKSNFTITLDIRIEGFMGINIQYLDGIVRKFATLDVLKLNVPHRKDDIETEMKTCLERWGIAPTQVVVVVTNNEAMVDAVSNIFGKDKHIPCFVYMFNSVVRRSIEIQDLSGLLHRVRSIMEYINQSMEARTELREGLKDFGSEEECQKELFIGDCTRWNTVLYMCDEFMKVSPILRNILSTKPGAPLMLNSIELEDLGEVVSLLRSLEINLKEVFHFDNCITISNVIPMIDCLEQLLKTTQMKSAIGKNLVLSLQSGISEEFKELQQNQLLTLAMILDPRFKACHSPKALTVLSAVDRIKRIESEYVAAVQSVSGPSNSATRLVKNLWELHKTLQENQMPNFNLYKEILDYLSEEVADQTRNPFEVWTELQPRYPHLYVLAQTFLSPVATSAPVEILLSKDKVTITEWSNAFSMPTLNELIFLHNLPDQCQ